MADSYSRVSSGETIGAFAMQHGPGTEDAFGGVALAFSESAPVIVIPAGCDRDMVTPPNSNPDPDFYPAPNGHRPHRQAKRRDFPQFVVAHINRPVLAGLVKETQCASL